jgi:hypothetical protein
MLERVVFEAGGLYHSTDRFVRRHAGMGNSEAATDLKCAPVPRSVASARPNSGGRETAPGNNRSSR